VRIGPSTSKKASVSSSRRTALIRLSLDDLFRRHPPLEGTYTISMVVNTNTGGRELDAYKNVASRAPLLKASIPGVVALSFVTVLLRLVARGWIMRRVGAADWLIVLAWVRITINECWCWRRANGGLFVVPEESLLILIFF